MRFILLVFLMVIFAACNNTDQATKSARDTTIAAESGEGPVPEARLSGCYIKILARDTMVLHLEQSGDSVFGRMSFDNYEKDGSTGTVHGRIDGDMIRLWYDFRSEGMSSVMQLFFKKEKDGVIRGEGAMEAKGDTAYFINTSSIQYPAGNLFAKQDCKKLAEKYR